MTLRETYYTN